MRKIIIAIVLLLTFNACKKSIPTADAIKLNVYTTKILNANTNEPETLYWYVRYIEAGGLYYYTSTQRLIDFRGLKFLFSVEKPTELKSANQIDDIVVLISNLEGDIVKDLK
ncbi:hypothetical protein QWY86_16640 [Pedobacter aquatilis]|uniref:hypothetical protein n=1 Tax=Pedobacter aquatilis TaxID=351343 RepID=UPI0025B32840|nr:hypothetical protein [Pedobacter aquatilis]MDN3588313.1 hypothetical protein [Pedobacter aquatilis]